MVVVLRGFALPAFLFGLANPLLLHLDVGELFSANGLQHRERHQHHQQPKGANHQSAQGTVQSHPITAFKG